MIDTSRSAGAAVAQTFPDTSDRELVGTRVFDAPRELVFKVWTDPAHLGKWWGPRGFTTTTYAMDMKPGGVWRFCMHGPDGVDYQNKITFLEIAEPERLVYKHGGDGEPVDFHVTVSFEEEDGKTRLTMRMVFPSTAERDDTVEKYGADKGLVEHLDRLGEYAAQRAESQRNPLKATLPTAREIVLTRVFDAPRRLVFEALTRPEHMARWFGPNEFTNVHCEMDVRPGGAYRIVLRAPDGHECPFKGVYREVVPPERLVFTFIYDVEGLRDHEALETMILHEDDGRTTLTRTILAQTTEARDGLFHSGLEAGAAQSYERLAALLKTMTDD